MAVGMMDKPSERGRTIRQRIVELLLDGQLGAGDISRCLGIREKAVYDHLSHIRRSMRSQGKKLITIPSRCLGCGYTFKDRRRLTPPGRCPRCRASRISDPVYKIGD
jgi:predicted Zn-ribbon and HTH transcriptional regulator